MHFKRLLLLGAFVTIQCVSGAAVNGDELDQLTQQALDVLRSRLSSNTAKKSSVCTLENVKIRRDWAALSAGERKEYIRAVQCITSKAAITPVSLATGTKTRFDDFVATHMNQTLSIHGTGNFLGWHRYMVYTYETALREECGYTGYQPYWNWPTFSEDQTKSPVFDGSDTSMSGDGEYVPHNGSVSGTGNIFIPSGNGGGCIKDGPFVGMMANLGPVAPGMSGEVANNGSLLSYNPRCLKRDISAYASSTWLTMTNILNVTLNENSVYDFQNELQGRFADGFLGLHASGHFVMGGDADDLFSSPNDPAFYLHHAMVDRVWWLWQMLHYDQAFTVGGTITILNMPPSRNATVNDLIDIGVNAPSRTLGSVLDTMSNGFCYIYL